MTLFWYQYIIMFINEHQRRWTTTAFLFSIVAWAETLISKQVSIIFITHIFLQCYRRLHQLFLFCRMLLVRCRRSIKWVCFLPVYSIEFTPVHLNLCVFNCFIPKRARSCNNNRLFCSSRSRSLAQNKAKRTPKIVSNRLKQIWCDKKVESCDSMVWLWQQ